MTELKGIVVTTFRKEVSVTVDDNFDLNDAENVLIEECDGSGTDTLDFETTVSEVQFGEANLIEVNSKFVENVKLSFEQVQAWIGSDTSRNELITMIKEIANGEYNPSVLYGDIATY